MLLLQAVQAIPEGPAWVVGLSAGATLLAGAFKLGVGVMRPTKNGHSEREAVAFQTSTKMTLDRLTTVSEKLSDTMALAVQTMDRLGELVDDHDQRTAQAIQRVETTHRLVEELHKRIVVP